MKILTSSQTQIADRISATVLVGAHRTSGGAAFILAQNAEFTTASGSAVGTFSAYTCEPFSLVGDAVTIMLPGILFAGTKIHHVRVGEPADLSYIDGCSNSNLIAPPRNGDPCTNYLYFPPNINQSIHSHPSFRLGMVMSGAGTANVGNEKIALTPGKVFLLDRFVRHGFSTDDSHMSLMVFHPDSDDGPTDEHNPMKKRTYL